MKKTINFDLFEKGQSIYFDILRLAELEKALGMPITAIITRQETGIGFCLTALRIGMKQHYRRGTEEFYADLMEKHFDNDGTLEDILVPIIRALMASGVFGKEAIEKIEKKVADDQEADVEDTKKNA